MTDNVTLAAQQAAGLRALADMIEANPDFAELARPYIKDFNAFYALTKDDMARIARAGLAHGAKVDKKPYSDTFELTLRWGPVGAAALGTRSNVCERVVVGTETITKSVPDPEALKTVPQVEVTETVERVEWRCAPVLAGNSEPAAA